MASADAKRLLSIRIPPTLDGKITGLAKQKNRDKTSVAIELLQRGLDSLEEAPIKSAQFVPQEDFEELAKEVRELKKHLVSAA